jgi:hypothetical protein
MVILNRNNRLIGGNSMRGEQPRHAALRRARRSRSQLSTTTSSGYSGNVEAADLFKITFQIVLRSEVTVLLVAPRSRFANIM